MIEEGEGIQTVKYAKSIIKAHVINKPIPSLIKPIKFFKNKNGVFVTIHSYPSHNLRGCIGIPLPVMSLSDAIIEAAKSVTHDPRFPPLDKSELNNIIVEVTILTPPELIEIEKPEQYLTQIEIGRDGLIAEQGFFKGLLLPQVPVEQGWDKEEFLSHTCMKAGLMPDAWFDKNTKIFKFSGQIFSEVEPDGKIMEKNLDGSNC